MNVDPNTESFLEPDGGYLLVERCIEAFQSRARRNGDELRFDSKISSWRKVGNRFEVVTEEATFSCSKLVLALGPWTSKIASELGLPLSPKRTVQCWFRPRSAVKHPVFFQDARDGRWIYGFPEVGGRVKIAFHNVYENCDPDTVRRSISSDEVAQIRKYGEDLIPNLGDFDSAKTCMYTMTPDENFVLGSLGDQSVFIAAGFSGHGFKFATVVGEIAEDLLFRRGRYGADLQIFDPRRF